MAGNTDTVLPRLTLPTWRSVPRPSGIAATVPVIGGAILLGQWLHGVLPPANLSLVFLTAVLACAVWFGFWAGLVAAALAFLGYNFFFVEPLYTLLVTRPEDALALAVFLLAAALTGFLAGRMREAAQAARHRAAMLELLSAFSLDLGQASTIAGVEATMLTHLTQVEDSDIVLVRVENGQVSVPRTMPAGLAVGAVDLQMAERAARYGSMQPATAQGWDGSRFSFHPLPLINDARDIVGIARRPSGRPFAIEAERATLSMVRQGAVAIERLVLAQAARDAREKADKEALRSALLTSLSHDLRTPLATILGSVTSLRQLGDALGADARADLLLAIEEETGRLGRYVANLLHMTRLQSGLDPHLEWIDPADAAQGAVRRARIAFPHRAIALAAPTPSPLIHSDASLFDLILFNLIENAVKFSPADKPVQVAITRQDDRLTVTVTDQGRGIAEQDRDRLFDAFFRGGDTVVPGTGLGLSICKGSVQALGGSIEAESPVTATGGTRMRVVLPTGDARPA